MLKNDSKEILYYQVINTPLGPFRITADSNYLRAADFFCPGKQAEQLVQMTTPLLEAAAEEFTRYFKGELKSFTVPFSYRGTAFQERVWSELCRIPYGTTITYGELARRIGNPRAARAVGQANNRNPLAVIVPCHRVIGTAGKLVGYASGLDKKAWLLSLEEQSC